MRIKCGPAGLIASPIALAAAGHELLIRGLEMRTLGSEETQPIAIRHLLRGDRLLIEHHFRDNITVRTSLSLTPDRRLLRCRIEPTDRIEMIRNGPLDARLTCLAVDYGWLIKNPGKFTRPRLMTNFFLGKTDRGAAILIGCDQTERLVVDPQRRLYSLRAMYRTASVTYWFGLGANWAELIDAYRRATRPHPAPRAWQLVGRLVLDDWSASPYDHLAPLLASLQFVRADRLIIIRHNWQHYGYDVRLPDVYPPNPRFGSLQQLARFARLCQNNDVLFGLHDNLSDLYLDAPSLRYCRQAYQPSEWHAGRRKAWLGWYNRRTGQRAVRHTPGSAIAMMRRNLSQITTVLPVSATFLDVTSYTDPVPLETPTGQFISPDRTLQTQRQMYRQAGDLVAGPAIGEGCTEKFLGAVDGANCDLWHVKRWGNDPAEQDWQYFPLLDFLAHHCLVLQGAGYPQRFGQQRHSRLGPEHYQRPFIDDYRSASLLFGHAPLYFLTSARYSRSLPGIAREYYLGVPFHRQVGLQRIVQVRHEPDDIHRLTVRYADGTIVHVNRGRSPWIVAGWILPRFGVAVRGHDFSQATAIWQGHPIDVVVRPRLLFLDMRGVRRSWLGVTTAGMLAIHKRPDRLEVIPLAGVDSLQLDLSRLLLDHQQISRVELQSPDGQSQPIDYHAQQTLKLQGPALRLPPAETEFAPLYRKIVIYLTCAADRPGSAATAPPAPAAPAPTPG